MQRAAASKPSPTASAPSTPPEPSSKRLKRNDSSPFSTAPATPSDEAQAIRDALAIEEAKRIEALDRQREEGGETKWVLSTLDKGGAVNGGGVEVVQMGYAEIDGVQKEEEEPWRGAVVGRRSFGRFNRALEVSMVTIREGEEDSNVQLSLFDKIKLLICQIFLHDSSLIQLSANIMSISLYDLGSIQIANNMHS
jgi:hypothetical protein